MRVAPGRPGYSGREKRYAELRVSRITIQYCFQFDDQPEEIFDLHLDPETLELVEDASEPLPDWTRLDFQQCRNCPLKVDEHPRCPVAANMVRPVSRFAKIISHSQVRLTVITKERTTVQETTAQEGLSSLMGLIMASSNCPHTAYFRPMARFHLPMASSEETVYRAITMYLLAQYFLRKAGREPDLDLEGLKKLYENLEKVNMDICERLRAATEQDSTLNAVVLLDFFAKTAPFGMEMLLGEMRPLFETSFLKEVPPPSS